MAYQLNKTDGTIVATVADGQLDTLSTDLSLIGKNFSGFGEALNENFIKLLENFADTARPIRPVRGQLWFDTSELKLKVYSGTEFVPVSSATIANNQPATLGVGDLWFDNLNKQLFFFDGASTILLGPAFSISQGLSGLKVESILDTLNQTRVVTLLYTNGQLLGIFSKDSFTPKIAIQGFTGNINPGFNAGDLSGIKFNVTCTNSDSLGGAPAITYVRTDTSNIINGQIRITSDLGLIIGEAGQANLVVNNGDVILSNSASGRDLIFDVRKGIQQEVAFKVVSDSRSIGLYEDFSDSEVNIGGDLTIGGNLTVQGSTTTINTSEVTVEDKSITLARQTGITPTDENASPGGIILQGASSHILLWSKDGQPAQPASPEAIAEGFNDGLPSLASMAWTSSDHFNLAQNKYYAIDGVPVIEQTSTAPGAQTFRLTAAVTAIDGVTSFGKQIAVTIGPGSITDPAFLRLEDNVISTEQTDQDLVIAPNGTGNIVLNNNTKITNLTNPTAPQDASTKEYVDNTIQTRNIVLSMDLTDNQPNSYIITNILNNIAPPVEYRNGTQARILCTVLSNSSTTLDLNPLIIEGTSTAEFVTPSGTAQAVTSISVGDATLTPPTISTTRIIKIFQISVGVWIHLSDATLPAA
jgi:hypothetical protein